MQKRTVRGATVRHDGHLVISACHLAPLGCTASRHVRLEQSRGDTSMDALERGHRVAACRGKRLAAAVILSGPEACRSPGLEVPWLVFPASSSCRGLVALPERVARRGKFLGVPWLVFPANSSCGALSPELKYFVLEWLQGNHGGSWC